MSYLWVLLVKQSLIIRTTLVLVLGLIVTQVVSFQVISSAREADTRQKMFDFMAADLALAHDVLIATPLEERPELMDKLNRGFYDLSLRDANSFSVDIRPGLFANLREVSNRIGVDIDRDDLRWVWIGQGSEERPALLIPVGENQVLEVDAKDPIPALPLWTVFTYLGLIFLVMSLLSWLALLFVMQPVKRFAVSAEQVGYNLTSPVAVEREPYEFRNVVGVLERMRLRILAEFDRHTRMLAGISHDLKTPITRIMLRLQMMEDDAMRDKLIEDLDYMSSIINQSVEYGRTSIQVPEKRILDIAGLLKNVCEGSEEATGKPVTFTTIGEPRVLGHMGDLSRAFQNIIDNALKYAGHADVKMHEDGDEVVIYIRDKGLGIPEDLIHNIGQPYYRPDSSRNSETGGSGLGMSITMNIVSSHEGVLQIRNCEPGLEVSIRLPRIK